MRLRVSLSLMCSPASLFSLVISARTWLLSSYSLISGLSLTSARTSSPRPSFEKPLSCASSFSSRAVFLKYRLRCKSWSSTSPANRLPNGTSRAFRLSPWAVSTDAFSAFSSSRNTPPPTVVNT